MDLSALLSAVAAALAGAPSALDGRVREVPDERTFRWYQSAGLVDKPLRYEGRSAVYGRRHLLQALAIKVLQSRGLTLAQIQRALAGVADAQLESAVLEGLGPAALGAPSPDTPPVAPPVQPGAPPRMAVEIAPGVLVVLDPAQVADPAAVLQRLTLALQGVRS